MITILTHRRPLQQRPLTLPARRFNRVRLALRRLESPLQITLPELNPHIAVLNNDVWIIHEGRLQTHPVAAITDFRRRRSLHSPVTATLHLYHEHAERLLPYLLHLMDGILQRRLDRQREARPDPAGVARLADIPKKR